MSGSPGKFFSLVIALLFFAYSLGMSSATDRESLHKAKGYIQAGKNNKAERLLKSILAQRRLPSEAEEAFVLLTDIELHQGSLHQALSLIDNFNAQYQNSRYASRMDYYLAVIRLKQNQYFQSALTFADVLNSKPSEKLYRNSKHYLFEIVKNYALREEELQKVTEVLTQNEDVKSSLMIALGNIQIKEKRYKSAHATFSNWIKLFPKNPQSDQIEKTVKDLSRQDLEYKTVLLMLPITGVYADVGKALSQGLLLRLEPYFQKSDPPIRYQILDTYGDPVSSVYRLRKALKEENIVAVVGPAMSDVSVAVATELSHYSEIPMVTPTATTHGISYFGKNIFQLNVTTYALGQLISNYAMDCMNLKEYAILAPNSAYGVELSKTFETIVHAKGGSIIAKQFYDPQEKDFSGYFKVIRTRKIKSDYNNSWRGLERLSREMPTKAFNQALSDSVLKLDGIFIPASNADEAHKMSSQTSYHKLKTQVLGSSGWHDEELLKKGFSTTKGTVFSSDNLQGSGEMGLSFKKEYQKKWGEDPDRISVLGYDAASFLVEGMQKSKDVMKGLKKVKTFKGVYGNIEMSPDEGHNMSVSLFKVGRKEFEPLDYCKTKK